MDCIHAEVCKFRKGVMDGPIESEMVTIFHKGKKPKYHNLTTSDKDIKKARIILKDRRMKEMLTTDQATSLDQYKGVHTKNLTEPQKEQILSILKNSFKK